MEPWELELIETYKDQDEELKACVLEHQELERKIEELNARVYLTPEEEYERKRLQKLKLAGRDKMEQILSRYRTGASGSA
jgi:uncharacterized protein YdcH (DUF465 family)